MTPPTPTRAEREDAIWAAYYHAIAPAEAAYSRAIAADQAARDAYERALAPAQAAREAALEALEEEP